MSRHKDSAGSSPFSFSTVPPEGPVNVHKVGVVSPVGRALRAQQYPRPGFPEDIAEAISVGATTVYSFVKRSQAAGERTRASRSPRPLKSTSRRPRLWRCRIEGLHRPRWSTSGIARQQMPLSTVGRECRRPVPGRRSSVDPSTPRGWPARRCSPTSGGTAATGFLLHAVRWFETRSVPIERTETETGICYASGLPPTALNVVKALTYLLRAGSAQTVARALQTVATTKYRYLAKHY